ncbi:MAG: TniB family NTP-binding protein [Negativicutes bacterium]|nr:TniB family NTP-binding protein [Negativicutes bacterium]
MARRLSQDELMLMSHQERLDYFKNTVIIAHKHAKIVLDALFDLIKNPGESNIIYVPGPTGVGKTTMIYRLVDKILAFYKETMETDPGFIPVLYVEAKAPSVGNFQFKSLFRRILESAREPLIQYKISSTGEKTSEEVFEIAARSCLKNRKTKVCIIDEGHHIGKISGGRKLLDHLEALKSFIDSTDTIFIFVGTYYLTNFIQVSGQLSRRSHVIHFPRYRANYFSETSKDIGVEALTREDSQPSWSEYDDFSLIADYFAERIPIENTPDFSGLHELLYARSVGCVGILKGWLYDALKLAQKNGDKTISKSQLEETALEFQRAIGIAREALEGEEIFSSLMQGESELYSLLGVAVNSDSNAEPGKMPSNKQPAREKTKKQPGKRKPTRDVVGGKAM